MDLTSNLEADDFDDESTTIISAAFGGHVAAVKRLLDQGADASEKQDNGVTGLHGAAQGGHEDVVQLLLERGADASAQDQRGSSALHLAAQNKHERVVKLLLRQGADASARTQEGWAVLHAALYTGNDTILTLVLDAGADVMAARRDNGSTALHMAADMGYKIATEKILDRGADASAKDNNGYTALHIAAQKGHISILRLLLEHGADTAAKNVSGWTALHGATSYNHETISNLLLDRGANVLAAMITGVTPLHVAAEKGYESIAKLLLDRGADVLAVTNVADTALHTAAREGYEGVVKVLVERGADIFATDQQGLTALQLASKGGHYLVVKCLLQQGINVRVGYGKEHSAFCNAAINEDDVSTRLRSEYLSMASNEGATALHLAAFKGDETMVELLLGHGAESSAKTEKGWTALLMAAAAGHNAVVKLLLEHGAEASTRAKDGGTALLGAAEGGYEDIVKMLLERGAISTGQDAWPVLYASSKRGHKSIFGLVLDSCAKMSADKDISPLHEAAAKGCGGVVTMLLEHGVYVSDTLHDGTTALHITAERGDLAVLKILLSWGADPSAVNGNGCTAFDLASQNEHDIAAKVLSEYSTEVSPETMRWTAHLARLMSSGTVFNPYHYKSLGHNQNFIRLLYLDSVRSDDAVISGSLRIVSLDDDPYYIAVSYAWGQGGLDQQLLCDGCKIPITSTLHAALKRFRRTAERVFWADQVCINQSDIPERSQQVGIMSTIYRQAKAVFIWLGDHDETTEDGIKMAKYVSDSALADPIQPGSASGILPAFWLYTKPEMFVRETWEPWLSLYRRPWYSRLWVVQEYICGRVHRIFCGDFEFPEKLFMSGVYAVTLSKAIPPALLIGGPEVRRNLNNLGLIYSMRAGAFNHAIADASISEGFDCKEPKDKIYALLGTVPDDPNRPEPNYGLSDQQVYKQFAMYFIMTGYGFKMIEEAGLTASIMLLPTWCPDWSRKEFFRGNNSRAFNRANHFKPRIIPHQNPAWVTVDGSLVDVITEIGPSHVGNLILTMYDEYRAWFDGSAKLIEEALASKYIEDGNFVQLWCRLLVGAAEAHNERLKGFMKYHNKVREPHEDPKNSALLALHEKRSRQTDVKWPDSAVQDMYFDTDESLAKEGIALSSGDESEGNSQKPQFFIDSYHSSTLMRCSGCRVCVTANGFLGLVGAGAQPGDFVSILFGIPSMKVLRPVEETYQNVESVFMLPVLGEYDPEVDPSEIILR